ncbi:MAG: chromophore lyase, partial [Verrucomicrobiota bacterium]|nr:chromophore lyase [Verrucomicrobiota bacterium]
EAYYACLHCHEEMAGHAAVAWGKGERETRAVLCGKCRQTLSIKEYLGCGNLCPFCGAAFNPGCARHYPAYFEM